MGGAIGIGIGIPFSSTIGAGASPNRPVVETQQWDEVGYVNGASTMEVEVHGEVITDNGFPITGNNGTYARLYFGTNPKLDANPFQDFTYPVVPGVSQSALFTSLSPSTKYYYGIIAENSEGKRQGKTIELTTPALEMIVTYDTTLTFGIPNPVNQNNVIRLPFAPKTYIENPSYNLDITVDWGDGTTDVYNTNPVNFPADVPIHTYATPGTYDVTITPNGRGIQGWSFTSSQNDAQEMASTKLTEIKQWGDMVYGCPPNPTNIQNSGSQGSRYWYECKNLGPINAPDTPMIVGQYARRPQVNWGSSRNNNLGLPRDNNIARINDWDLRPLIRFEGLFDGCPTFNGDVSNWYMPNVERMQSLFQDCTIFNSDVSRWNTDNLGHALSVFNDCSNFNSDCSTKTVTRKAVYNSGRSGNYKTFTDTAWNMDNAYNLGALFSRCTSFDNGGNQQGLNTWNIGLATPPSGERYNLSNLFNETQFNGDLNNWDVSQCQQFQFTFYNNSVFNGDITNWDFSGLGAGNCAASSILFFLRGTTSFNQDISNWDLTGAGGLNGLMGSNFPPHPLPNDPTLDTSIYNDVLVNFSALGNYSRAANCSFWGSSNYFVFGNSQYDANDNAVVAARNQLIADLGAIVDGGPVPPTPLTDATFQTAINDILAQDPNGDFNLVPYGRIQNWDTSQVTNMSTAFLSRSTFNGDISGWDTSSVTTMSNMFNAATIFNQDISGWDTSSVTTFSNMFRNAAAFNQALSSWDTSNVTDLTRTFEGATAFNGHINGWNIENVGSLVQTFNDATSFNQSLSNWDTSNVTTMSSMFNGASSFNQNINSFNTSNVTTMTSMFKGATAFNQPLNNWDTSSVNDIGFMFMFEDATSFDQDIDSWDVSSGRVMSNMFKNATSFNQDLNSWVTSSLELVSNMFDGATSFNGQVDAWDMTKVTKTLYMFHDCTSFNQPLNSWNLPVLEEAYNMFDGATLFNQDLDNWNTSSTFRRAENMFNGATSFNGQLQGWNTSGLETFRGIFQGATSFNQPLNGWDTSAVIGFGFLEAFDGATSFNQDLNNWDLSNSRGISFMFRNATSFNGDLSGWDLSLGEQMQKVFEGATAFNRDISGWIFTNAAFNMIDMFKDATSFNQDLSGWNVASVQFCTGVFTNTPAWTNPKPNFTACTP